MNDAFFAGLSAWLTQAGLAGTLEIDILSGFCERCVAAGLPLARALLFVDTLHPVHEGRLVRWGYGASESPLLEYGRTSTDALAASGSEPRDVETPSAGAAAHITRWYKPTCCICVPVLVGSLIRCQFRHAPVIGFGGRHAQHGQVLPCTDAR
jgi:hypothetical protein